MTETVPSDAELSNSSSDSDAEKQSKPGNGMGTSKRKMGPFVGIKSFVLGEKAQLGGEDVNQRVLKS